MEQIGYALIDGAGNEIQSWGNSLGQQAAVPSLIVLPNGDQVHAPQLGVIQDWKLVPRMMELGTSDATAYDGTHAVVTKAVTADHVRAEAQRRIVALMGARDLASCIIKQLNALMRATELANKKADGGVLTQPEADEAIFLQSVADEVKRLRAVSNTMEESPPSDYTADERWQ